jgi:TPR repeat protein
VGADEAEAVSLYRQACDGADALACKNLGGMYENGKGIGKDDAQAVTFYRKACDANFGPGCTSLGVEYVNGRGVTKDSYERGCQEKKPLPAPLGWGGCLACIQPRYRLLRGGAVGVPCQLLEHDQASCMLCLLLVSCCDGGSTPSVRKAAQAEVLAPDKVPTMILFETRGL